MKGIIRLLYCLREGETHLPGCFARAGLDIHLIRAGTEPDPSSKEFQPQLIAIHAPFDFETRVAVQKCAELDLPAIGIGYDPPGYIDACVSEDISVPDLKAVLELAIALSTERRSGRESCRAENSGQCHGRVTDDTIRLLEHLLSLRLPDYRERAERMFETCLSIGSHLCLPPAEMKDLLRAARLREIGKLGIPDRILFARRETRTTEEQATYDRYPVFGARVMSEMPALRGAAAIVEHQLENFDGSGPTGLMAHQIPLGARILRVAGAAVSVMMSGENRDLAGRQALRVLENGQGSAFDPLLVKLIVNFFNVRPGDRKGQDTYLVRITDLEVGMVLAEDVWSRTGMKIIPNGTQLSEHIVRLVHQFPLDPSLEAVHVYRQ